METKAEEAAVGEKPAGAEGDRGVLGTIRAMWTKIGILFIFIGMVVLASILSPAFLKTGNLMNVVMQVSYIGLIALGVTGVIVSAGVDLSSGSIVALTAVVSASFAQRPDWAAALFPGLTGLPFICPLAIGLLVGTLVGFVNGALIAKTNIPPFIATLGTMTAVRGLAQLYSRGRPVSGLTDAYNFVGQGSVLGVPFAVVLLLVLAVATHFMYSRTRFGRYVYAIGGNVNAARVSGINVGRNLIMIYTYAGFLASVAGIVVASRIGSGQPGLGNGYELQAITAAVIGGTSFSSGGIGTVPGTIIGTLIIGVLNNILVLTNVSAYFQDIIRGVIIVGAVIIDERRRRVRK
jgi:inositol transport system permease protein